MCPPSQSSNSSEFFDGKSEYFQTAIDDISSQLINVKAKKIKNSWIDGGGTRDTLPTEGISLLDEIYFSLDVAIKDLDKTCDEFRRNYMAHLNELDKSLTDWHKKAMEDLYQKACKDTGRTLTWEQFKDNDYLLALKLEKVQKEIEEMLKRKNKQNE